jgi:hypothetical protein
MNRNHFYFVFFVSMTIVFSSCGSGDKHISKAKLLFKSGFEKGVYLDAPQADEGGVWYQDIKGSDVEGFSFPINIWETKGIFQVLVDSELNASAYIQNKIISTKGHNDVQSRVLSSHILKADKPWTQDPYILMNAKEDGDLYVSYWLKLPKDLLGVLGDGSNDDGWCTFFEWKTSGDYRIAAYVYIEEGKPYWYVHGDNVANQEIEVPYAEYWFKENKAVAVPEGEWFHVEFFWHRSTGSDGRFWWAIDGNVIVDYHGANKIKEPIDRIMLFTVYAEKYPLTQLVDDIEIWNGFPCGEGESCHGKK